MIIIFTKRGILIEPTTDGERGEIIQKFIKVLQHTIFLENHRYKQGTIPEIVEFINKISLEMNIRMLCDYNPKKEGFKVVINDKHIKFIPLLAQEFKDRYRKGEHLNGDNL